MFCLDVQGHLRKEQAGAYAAGGYGTQGLPDVLNDLLGQFSGTQIVHLEIRRYVQEGFVNGTSEDILRSQVLQKDPVDLRSTFNVQLHPECIK